MKPAAKDYDNLLLTLENSMHGAEMIVKLQMRSWDTNHTSLYSTILANIDGEMKDTKNSHVGQGVWNLKKTPVVYRSNFINTLWASNQGMPSLDGLYPYGYQLWYFFDPSSIEVELNPNVFPEDQIEWMQVDALCGVRSTMRYNGTDSYLKALGIGKNELLALITSAKRVRTKVAITTDKSCSRYG